MSERVPGCDVSHWQGVIDWAKMAQNFKFVFIKASQGSWPDVKFKINWANAKSAGLLRGAYLFYDYRINARAQGKFFLSLLAGDLGELPPVIDAEPVPGVAFPDRSAYLAALKDLVELFTAAYGRAPLIYSNPATLTQLKPIPSWLLACPLWIAHYGVNAPNPMAWPRWSFWQFTDRLDGLASGVTSKQLDGNYWYGTLEELRNWAGLTAAPAEKEPAPPVDTEYDSYQVTAESLLVRLNPHVGAQIVGSRKQGDVVRADEVEIWIRDSRGWSAVRHGGKDYMERLP
jgi:lysozyme